MADTSIFFTIFLIFGGAAVLATLINIVISTYYVVFRYPTPIAVSDKLRRS